MSRPRAVSRPRLVSGAPIRGAARVGYALFRHPSLWITAFGQVGRLAPPGWWRRPPFLPVPDPDYLHFRLETQYGTDVEMVPHDLIVYLEWCRHNGR